MAAKIDANIVFYGHLSELYQLAKEGKIKTTLEDVLKVPNYVSNTFRSP